MQRLRIVRQRLASARVCGAAVEIDTTIEGSPTPCVVDWTSSAPSFNGAALVD
jgi:hypothetical protein